MCLQVLQKVSIENTVMQGSVWGSLMYTATMSKIGDQAYENLDLCYVYKNIVAVAPLGMIDDLLCIQKCNKSYTAMNTFVELKKLNISDGKCNQMHIGKSVDICSELKVHLEAMNKSNIEKCLGDIVSTSGNIKENISKHVCEEFAVIIEINNIL